MILKNSRYSELAEKIKTENKRIVIYGAGMIGQIAVPYFIQTFGLERYVECYVDMDRRKQGETVQIGGHTYKILSSDYLKAPAKSRLLLVTNSKFFSIIRFLDDIRTLDLTECYIIPLIQILESENKETVTVSKLTGEQMIPRKIHYCWFGRKEMPDFLADCIKTWKKYCPDYEIICWNEDNYDVDRIPFAGEAYRQKKYGFVTDAARLDILYEYGGIYMDTDVSLLKNLDTLLYQPAFTGVEKWGNINTGGMAGAMPRHPMIKEMLEYRKQFHFVMEDGSLNMETNGMYETVPFIRYGMKISNELQYVNNVTVYPSCVFHPYDYMSCEKKIQKSTFSVHHFYGGWMDGSDFEERSSTQKKYHEILKRTREEC